MINLANLKDHSYRITLYGRKHFGFFINGNAMRPPKGANLHQWLTNEPAVIRYNGAVRNAGSEKYLHEAGLVGNAPSGTVYYNGIGEAFSNLGLHEHWNNSMEKQYGRNLGEEEGIELIRISPAM